MPLRQWQATQLKRSAQVNTYCHRISEALFLMSDADTSTDAMLLSNLVRSGLPWSCHLNTYPHTRTMHAGDFVSQRTFDSVWENDECMFTCLAHAIFNRTDPQHSYGKFAIDNASKYVNVSVLDSSTSAVFTGDRFGCQLSLVNQARLLTGLA